MKKILQWNMVAPLLDEDLFDQGKQEALFVL